MEIYAIATSFRNAFHTQFRPLFLCLSLSYSTKAEWTSREIKIEKKEEKKTSAFLC